MFYIGIVMYEVRLSCNKNLHTDVLGGLSPGSRTGPRPMIFLSGLLYVVFYFIFLGINICVIRIFGNPYRVRSYLYYQLSIGHLFQASS